MTQQGPFNENVARWIRILAANRDENPMRAYLTTALEAAIRGAQTQVELNEHYANMKREGAASPWRESLDDFDFEAEAEVWKGRKAEYEQALKAIIL